MTTGHEKEESRATDGSAFLFVNLDLYASSAGSHEVHNNRDDGKDEQKVDQEAAHMKECEAAEPEHY